MKQTFKKLIALMMAAIMVIALVPTLALAEAIAKDNGDSASKVMPTGYIPAEIPGGRAVSGAYASGDMETYYNLTGANRDTLPSTYNSNSLGYITSVKNQNPYGSCWAHAAMACIESYMIKHNIPVGTGSAATTSLNLSETQHCYFNYSSAYDAEGMLTGDKCTLTGGDSCLDSGGNGEMSAYTLQRWCGAADESVSALAYGKASTVASSGLNSQYSYQYNDCHVQNSEWIPGTDIEGIKRSIMSYGAGNISYYETGSAYTYICTIDTTSQESSSHKWANHAITVVGWDDSIAVSNFKPNKPSAAGAWICKNSWGTNYFNSGYCYISYYDTSVQEGYIYFYDAEPIDNYDHNYQYDGSCNPVCYGKGWPSSEDYYVGFANNTQVANVFTAKGSELLKAVALCNWDEALSYTVEVYKNPTTGNPSSGTLMSTQSGTITYSGYYTIVLDTPVQLAQGDKFSVVFTQSCPTADENGKYIHTPYDATFNNSSVVSWANWTHTNHGDTSYYKEPNGSWTDCPDNGDYRIKAFTSDVSFTVTAVSNNTSWGTVSVNGNVINASPANGYYVESCDVISGSATCTINGNVITVSASADCTIRVNFAPKPTYTVSFVVSGEAAGSQSALVNDTITLPSSISVTAEGWTFIGWAAAQLEETTEAPAYYAPGASYTVTGNATLYALFTRVEEGTGDVVYQYVDHLEDGGKYLIVDSNSISGTSGYAVGNAIVANNHYLTAVSVTIDGDTCTATSSNLPKVLWEASSSGSGYTFYNAAVGKYMGLDSSEYLYPSSTALAWAYTSQGYMDNQTDSEGYYYLSFDTSNIRYTTNKSGKVINLYKEINTSVSYYTTDPVVAPPHVHTLTHVAAVAATCSQPGNIEYWYCAECGKYFSDAAAENEITYEQTVIPATGDHEYDGWTSNNNGTHSHYCEVCGQVETENCTYVDVVTDPTATEGGYTTHTCSVCGYSYVDSYTDPLGNDYLVSFSVPAGVAAVASVTCHEGNSITLPTAGAPEGYTFMGWVTEEVDNAAAAPANVLTGSYTPTGSITLYALYSKTTEAGYQLVTETPDSWVGSYVVTYGNTAENSWVLKGLTGTKKYESASAGGAKAFSQTGITMDGDTLTNVSDSYKFNVASGAFGKYTIRNAETGTYLASRGSYLYSYVSASTSYCSWSFEMNGSTMAAKNTASKTYPYLGFSTGSHYFMVSRTASDSIYFWKLTDGGTTTYTTVIG